MPQTGRGEAVSRADELFAGAVVFWPTRACGKVKLAAQNLSRTYLTLFCNPLGVPGVHGSGALYSDRCGI